MLKRPFIFVIPVPVTLFWCPCRTQLSLATAYRDLGVRTRCVVILFLPALTWSWSSGSFLVYPTSVGLHPIFWLEFLFSPFCVLLAYPRSRSPLCLLVNKLPEVVLGSRADSTTAPYFSGFRRWRSWASRFPEIRVLPATPAYVSLSLLSLFQASTSPALACFTSNPQKLVRLHLDGEYVPIFPTGRYGFSYHAVAHKIFFLAREVIQL